MGKLFYLSKVEAKLENFFNTVILQRTENPILCLKVESEESY